MGLRDEAGVRVPLLLHTELLGPQECFRAGPLVPGCTQGGQSSPSGSRVRMGQRAEEQLRQDQPCPTSSPPADLSRIRQPTVPFGSMLQVWTLLSLSFEGSAVLETRIVGFQHGAERN